MHELVVTKLYENGKIDDAIKARFIDDIYDIQKPLMRHTMLKIEEAFLRYGENYEERGSHISGLRSRGEDE
jgi:hypothetical protein